MEKYSVLMSVYYKESSENLKDAMDSMFEQSAPPDEFVLICDGPLTPQLDDVIAEKKKEYPDVLRVVRFSDNRGLGRALQSGLKRCQYDIVVRMDSDDISLPDRCEKQLEYMEKHPEVSLVGGAIAEFQTDPTIISSKRVVPEEHEAIVEFSKFRNPFNHMTLMYRKDDVLSAGGYRHFQYLEDYYLWIRMFIKGYKGHNLPDVLVYARIGNGMLQRRSGLEYAVSQNKLFKYMLKNSYITRIQYIKAVLTRTVISICPDSVRKFAYDKLLRV